MSSPLTSYVALVGGLGVAVINVSEAIRTGVRGFWATLLTVILLCALELYR